MTHLTYDDLTNFMKINEEYYTDDQAKLMERVNQHFDECEHCVNMYNEIIARQDIAEFVLSEKIMFGVNFTLVTEERNEHNEHNEHNESQRLLPDNKRLG